jgi:hypothetical protein
MVAKKEYLQEKLTEKQTKLLLQIVKEEVSSVITELLREQEELVGGGSGTGLGRVIDRSNTVGMFLSPGIDILNAIKFRAGEAGIKTVKTLGQLVANTLSAILPFNSHTVDRIDSYFEGWEDKALSSLDQQFAKERAEMMEGWDTFKTDFWGIGFVASPMSAIAGLAVGGKALDAAFSVLNVASGGRAERAYNVLTGERGSLREATEEQPAFKDLPEAEKKNVLAGLMKNPEVVKAVEQWSTTNLPKVLGSVVHDMNQAIASGKVGAVSPQEIASYKAMAPNLVNSLFNKAKGKNKKFEIKPVPAALKAASQVVQTDIAKMPDQAAQPQAPAVASAQQVPTKPSR